jgi:hypothetical protein
VSVALWTADKTTGKGVAGEAGVMAFGLPCKGRIRGREGLKLDHGSPDLGYQVVWVADLHAVLDPFSMQGCIQRRRFAQGDFERLQRIGFETLGEASATVATIAAPRRSVIGRVYHKVSHRGGSRLLKKVILRSLLIGVIVAEPRAVVDCVVNPASSDDFSLPLYFPKVKGI